MRLKEYLRIKTMLILILIPVLIITSISDLDARKRRKSSGRKYNPKVTRAQAIEIIRTSSQEVSQLAGIDPSEESDDENVNIASLEQSETLTDGIIGDSGEDLAELESEDDVTVDIETFRTLWLQYVDDDAETTIGGLKKKDIMDRIMDWLGTPYRFGGTSDRAIDCSAWTQRVFTEVASIGLPRTAREQFQVGQKIKRNNLQFGDLVFFHTYSRRFPSHVGIYLGDNLFAHASSRYGVTVSSLESTYYNKRFIGGKRLSSKDINQYTKGKTNEDEESN